MRGSPRDTIAAISTAAGTGAIAIVRVSGERALEVADAIFEGASLCDAASHTVHHGMVVAGDGTPVDEVLAVVMRGPHSYTTENMVEFDCHGGDVPAARVLTMLLAAGARAARRGEFTERAFLGGRLDLAQAEAVADIVSASTPRGVDAALGQLSGELSERLAALRERLLDLRAEIDACVDFPDEDVSGLPRASLEALAAEIASDIDDILRRCELGRAVRDGVSVAIVGRPNVGKSSIMNALLERDRSIVTALPGTTRDTVEASVSICGLSVTLIDTAGWREGGDEAERAGVERARRTADSADVAMLVLDGSTALSSADAQIADTLDHSRTVVALNKSDLARAVDDSGAAALAPEAPLVPVSALRGDGVTELRSAITRTAVGCDPSERASVTNLRHVDALRRCRAQVTAAASCVMRGDPVELASVELQEAASALGEITGETATDEVLERIFAKFCVGK